MYTHKVKELLVFFATLVLFFIALNLSAILFLDASFSLSYAYKYTIQLYLAKYGTKTWQKHFAFSVTVVTGDTWLHEAGCCIMHIQECTN